MLHHTRQLFIRQQTSVINAIQAHLAAFEIVAPVGRQGVEALLQVVADASEIAALGAQLRTLKAQCSSSTGGVARAARSTASCCRKESLDRPNACASLKPCQRTKAATSYD